MVLCLVWTCWFMLPLKVLSFSILLAFYGNTEGPLLTVTIVLMIRVYDWITHALCAICKPRITALHVTNFVILQAAVLYWSFNQWCSPRGISRRPRGSFPVASSLPLPQFGLLICASRTAGHPSSYHELTSNWFTFLVNRSTLYTIRLMSLNGGCIHLFKVVLVK